MITTLLLKYLFEVPNLGKRDGIIVRLYDEDSQDDRKYKVVEDTANYYNSVGIFGSEQIVFIVSTLKDLVEDSDLLIIVEDFRPREEIF